MRKLATLCGVLIVAGCASRGKVAPPPEPESVEPAAAEARCADCPPVDGAPPAVVVEIAPPVEIPDMEGECQRAAGFSEAGEHKPAVESLDLVLRAGASCEASVLGAVEESQRRLAEADDLARRGLEARRQGDVAAARESFRQALAVYPRYYWVQRLEHDLPADFSSELRELREAASAELAAGRSEEALELLERAAGLPAATPEVAAEAARVRTELASARLGVALRAQRTGDLTQALAWTERALATRPEPPLKQQVVEFARRLGLTLFSAGELVQARSVWRAALSLDESNERLIEYLDEVEARLRTLAAIADDGD